MSSRPDFESIKPLLEQVLRRVLVACEIDAEPEQLGKEFRELWKELPLDEMVEFLRAFQEATSGMAHLSRVASK